MVLKESAENYLETILMLNEKNQKVRSIDIVNELGFSKPSV
ncbi:MAG: metal-dependent transcriptional regulator, partial [Oscillospiraceae bacterium]|nr:metal-dependent transcriptional regulator [Oscillospiraceae bacterium]